jgi:hypothetical protein
MPAVHEGPPEIWENLPLIEEQEVMLLPIHLKVERILQHYLNLMGPDSVGDPLSRRGIVLVRTEPGHLLCPVLHHLGHKMFDRVRITEPTTGYFSAESPAQRLDSTASVGDATSESVGEGFQDAGGSVTGERTLESNGPGEGIPDDQDGPEPLEQVEPEEVVGEIVVGESDESDQDPPSATEARVPARTLLVLDLSEGDETLNAGKILEQYLWTPPMAKEIICVIIVPVGAVFKTRHLLGVDIELMAPLPEESERLRILEHYLEGHSVSCAWIAQRTPGWNIGDLRRLVHTATSYHHCGLVPKLDDQVLLDLIEGAVIRPIQAIRTTEPKTFGRSDPTQPSEFVLGGDQDGDSTFETSVSKQLYQELALSANYTNIMTILADIENGRPLAQEQRRIFAQYPFIIREDPQRARVKLRNAHQRGQQLLKAFKPPTEGGES